MNRDELYLRDIVEAIRLVERYAAGKTYAIADDELVRTWVLYHLMVIGEAARSLSPQTRAMHPEVPWRRIGDLRNVIVHQYSGVDIPTVRLVVERDLPELKRTVEAILQSFRCDQ